MVTTLISFSSWQSLQIGQVDLSDSNSDSDSDSGKLPGQNRPSELTACTSIDVGMLIFNIFSEELQI
jgi:hypothetical protein